jgi:hypothetical protein
LFEKDNCFLKRFRLTFIPLVTALQIKLIGFVVVGVLLRQLLLAFAGQF